MTNYYHEYYERFLAADARTRAESKAHWIACHKKNIASGRDDLIIFSAKILAAIALAENKLAAAK